MRSIAALLVAFLLAGPAGASDFTKQQTEWLAMLAQAQALSDLCPEHPRINRLVYTNVLLNNDIAEGDDADAYVRVGTIVLADKWREFTGAELCAYARIHFGPEGETHPWLLMFD